MPKKPKKSNTRFYQSFVGNYITIAMKDLNSSIKDGKFRNLIVGGILLDECEEYYYIGDELQVNAAIPKLQVVGIFLESAGIEAETEQIPPGTIRQ